MERQVPHNIPAERSLLGAIFLDNDTMFEVASIVTKEDFFEPGNGEIFILLRDQIEANRAATPQTILADMAQDADIGGIRASEYLNTLWVERAPTRDVAKELARGIADNAMKRRLMKLAEMLIEDCISAGVSTPATTIRDRHDVSLTALFSGLKDLGIRHIADYGDEVMDEITDAIKSDKDIGIPLGLAGLQDLMGAAGPGRVYAIAGQPGAGKSALAQQIMEYMTSTAGKIGLWIQAEMEGTEIAARAMSAVTEIPGMQIERALLDDRQIARLYEAQVKMRDMRLYIDASTSPSLARIKSRAMRMKRLQGLDVICIDHLLYLSRPGERMTDIEAIPYNMRELKAMAKDLHIPIIILMPLKSSYADGGDLRRPRMSDITYPAAVDQNADVIMFVHRPEYILRRNEPMRDDKGYAEWSARVLDWDGKAEFILAKRRAGEGTGIRQVYFDKRRIRFSDNVARLPKIDVDELPFNMQPT